MSELFSGSSVNTTVYQGPGTYTYVDTGLWNAGNSLLAAARALADLPDTYRYIFVYFPQWNYIIDNAQDIFIGYETALDVQVLAFHLSNVMLLSFLCVFIPSA